MPLTRLEVMDTVDPEVQRWTVVIDELFNTMSSAVRAGEPLICLQHYDVLQATPEVELVAQSALHFSDQLRLLESIAREENVLDPAILQLRRPASVPTQASTATAMATTTSADDTNGAGTAPVTAESSVGDATAVEENAAPSAALAEIKQVSVAATPHAVFQMQRKIEQAWGLALLAAVLRSPDEEEHHTEIVEDYERLFECNSDFLRAMRLPSRTVQELLALYKVKEGSVTPDVVVAALIKHPLTTTDEVVELVEAMKLAGVPVTIPVAEQLEKTYVKCMKTEDPEEVFERMTKTGLVPLSTRPFAMLFNMRTPVKKVKSVLDYYELMLDYGIAPEVSTMRLLCKQCSGMEFATLHFTLKQKNTAAAAAAAASTKASPSLPQGPSAPTSAPDSQRKNERTYFDKRLQELAETDPNTPLLEAMKVIHRAEVEGTSLEGDTLVLCALLRLFCRSTTPRKDLVLPFYNSLACRPEKVRLTPSPSTVANSNDAAGGDGEEDGAPGGPLSSSTAAGRDVSGGAGAEESVPNSDSDNNDMYDYDGGNSVGGAGGGGGGATSEKGGRMSSTGPTERRGARQPGIASHGEEAAYVLRVLAERGSIPDNRVLRALSTEFSRKKGFGWMEIVEQVALSLLQAGHDSRGAIEAMRCFYCLNLVHIYVRRHQRNKMLQLIRKIVMQFYEYTEIFHVSWNGEGGFDENGKMFPALCSALLHAGSLDMALGYFTLSLVMTDHPISEIMRGKLEQFRDQVYYQASSRTHLEVLNVLESYDWVRDRILCSDALMSNTPLGPPAKQMNGGKQQPVVVVVGGRTVSGGNVSGGAADGAVEPSEPLPSLASYLHLVLREIGVSREVMDWMKARLRRERQEALARRQAQSQ